MTDPDDDPTTATVDYDDGSGPQPLTITAGSFALDHTFADNGTYNVVITATDDESASGSNTVVVSVTNAAPAVQPPTPSAPAVAGIRSR